MTTDILKHTLRFIVLVLVQVLVIQHVNLSSYVILLPYVIWIIMLPFETPKNLVLVCSFAMGVCIDYFYDSSGLHTFACTAMGFSRHYVLKYIAPRDGYDAGVTPTVDDMGLEWFLRYAGTMVLIHHVLLFYIEIFRFSTFFDTLLRVFLSTLGTLVFIYIIQFLFFSTNRRNA